MKTILMLVLTVAVMSGCGTLDPAGPYAGDKVLYEADGAITASYELLHAFVKWEQERRPALTSLPQVTQYADYVRANSKAWFRSAIALRDAYKSDPGKDPAALQKALAVLRESAAQAGQYLITATKGT